VMTSFPSTGLDNCSNHAYFTAWYRAIAITG
jgi:hypothetical protein